MFLGQNSDVTQGSIMGQYSYDQLAVRRTALLYNSQNSYSVGIGMAYKAQIEANGGEVVIEETYTSTDQDHCRRSGFDLLPRLSRGNSVDPGPGV